MTKDDLIKKLDRLATGEEVSAAHNLKMGGPTDLAYDQEYTARLIREAINEIKHLREIADERIIVERVKDRMRLRESLNYRSELDKELDEARVQWAELKRLIYTEIIEPLCLPLVTWLSKVLGGNK